MPLPRSDIFILERLKQSLGEPTREGLTSFIGYTPEQLPKIPPASFAPPSPYRATINEMTGVTPDIELEQIERLQSALQPKRRRPELSQEFFSTGVSPDQSTIGARIPDFYAPTTIAPTIPTPTTIAPTIPESILPETQRKETPISTPEETPVAAPIPSYTEYVVRKGDTLSSIAHSIKGDPDWWTTIFAHNVDSLKNPNAIQVGHKLRIPPVTENLAETDPLMDKRLREFASQEMQQRAKYTKQQKEIKEAMKIAPLPTDIENMITNFMKENNQSPDNESLRALYRKFILEGKKKYEEEIRRVALIEDQWNAVKEQKLLESKRELTVDANVDPDDVSRAEIMRRLLVKQYQFFKEHDAPQEILDNIRNRAAGIELPEATPEKLERFMTAVGEKLGISEKDEQAKKQSLPKTAMEIAGDIIEAPAQYLTAIERHMVWGKLPNPDDPHGVARWMENAQLKLFGRVSGNLKYWEDKLKENPDKVIAYMKQLQNDLQKQEIRQQRISQIKELSYQTGIKLPDLNMVSDEQLNQIEKTVVGQYHALQQNIEEWQETLKKTDQGFTSFISGAINQGLLQGAGLIAGLLSSGASVLGIDAEDFARKMAQAKIVDQYLTKYTGDNLPLKVVDQGIATVISLTPFMVAPAALFRVGAGTLATAFGGAIPMSVAVGRDKYNELLGKGYVEREAMAYAMATALAEGLGETLSLGVIFKPGVKVSRKLLESSVTEALQEGALTEPIQALIDMKTIDPDMTVSDLLERMKLAASVGLFAGPVFGALGHAVESKSVRALIAQREQALQFIENPPEGIPSERIEQVQDFVQQIDAVIAERAANTNLSPEEYVDYMLGKKRPKEAIAQAQQKELAQEIQAVNQQEQEEIQAKIEENIESLGPRPSSYEMTPEVKAKWDQATEAAIAAPQIEAQRISEIERLNLETDIAEALEGRIMSEDELRREKTRLVVAREFLNKELAKPEITPERKAEALKMLGEIEVQLQKLAEQIDSRIQAQKQEEAVPSTPAQVVEMFPEKMAEEAKPTPEEAPEEAKPTPEEAPAEAKPMPEEAPAEVEPTPKEVPAEVEPTPEEKPSFEFVIGEEAPEEGPPRPRRRTRKPQVRPSFEFVVEKEEAAPTTEPAPAPAPSEAQMGIMADIPVVNVPVKDLKLSPDVPQFKKGATEEGIIEPLGGKYITVGTGPILVWKRIDGNLEIISGRHRFDLAKRTGKSTIAAQILNESDGWTVEHAKILDAMSNILDEKGTVRDYAEFFKGSRISYEMAEKAGLLARAKGNAGFRIANEAHPKLFELHQDEIISDAQAVAIIEASEKNPELQLTGIDIVRENPRIPAKDLKLMIVSEKGILNIRQYVTPVQASLFEEDSEFQIRRKAHALAFEEARRRIREIADRIRAVSGAAKNPEIARRYGVDVKDPESVRKAVEQWRSESLRLEEWNKYPDLAEDIGRTVLSQIAEGVVAETKVPDAPTKEEIDDFNKALEAEKKTLQQGELPLFDMDTPPESKQNKLIDELQEDIIPAPTPTPAPMPAPTPMVSPAPAPEAAVPEAVAPEAVAPEVAAPEAAPSEAAPPEVAPPEAVPPEAAAPKVAAPEVAPPEAVPPAAAPEAAAPEAAPPEAAPPEAAPPEAAVPEAAPPEVAPPEAAPPEVAAPKYTPRISVKAWRTDLSEAEAKRIARPFLSWARNIAENYGLDPGMGESELYQVVFDSKNPLPDDPQKRIATIKVRVKNALLDERRRLTSGINRRIVDLEPPEGERVEAESYGIENISSDITEDPTSEVVIAKETLQENGYDSIHEARDDLARQVNDILDTALSPEDAKAVRLIFINGMTQAQAAAEVGRSVSSIKRAIAKAREVLEPFKSDWRRYARLRNSTGGDDVQREYARQAAIRVLQAMGLDETVAIETIDRIYLDDGGQARAVSLGGLIKLSEFALYGDGPHEAFHEFQPLFRLLFPKEAEIIATDPDVIEERNKFAKEMGWEVNPESPDYYMNDPLQASEAQDEGEARKFARIAAEALRVELLGEEKPTIAVNSILDAAWKKVTDFFRRMRNFLRGYGFRTPEDVIGDIIAGKYNVRFAPLKMTAIPYAASRLAGKTISLQRKATESEEEFQSRIGKALIEIKAKLMRAKDTSIFPEIEIGRSDEDADMLSLFNHEQYANRKQKTSEAIIPEAMPAIEETAETSTIIDLLDQYNRDRVSRFARKREHGLSRRIREGKIPIPKELWNKFADEYEQSPHKEAFEELIDLVENTTEKEQIAMFMNNDLLKRGNAKYARPHILLGSILLTRFGENYQKSVSEKNTTKSREIRATVEMLKTKLSDDLTDFGRATEISKEAEVPFSQTIMASIDTAILEYNREQAQEINDIAKRLTEKFGQINATAIDTAIDKSKKKLPTIAKKITRRKLPPLDITNVKSVSKERFAEITKNLTEFFKTNQIVTGTKIRMSRLEAKAQGIPEEIYDQLVEYAAVVLESGAKDTEAFAIRMADIGGDAVGGLMDSLYRDAVDFLSQRNITTQTLIITDTNESLSFDVEARESKPIEEMSDDEMELTIWDRARLKVQRGVAQSIKEALDKEAKESEPGDPLFVAVNTIANQLIKKAREGLDIPEKAPIEKMTPAELIQHVIQHAEHYQDEVLRPAQEELRDRFKDTPSALEFLDDFFGLSFVHPFSRKFLKYAIRDAIDAIGFKNPTISELLEREDTVWQPIIERVQKFLAPQEETPKSYPRVHAAIASAFMEHIEDLRLRKKVLQQQKEALTARRLFQEVAAERGYKHFKSIVERGPSKPRTPRDKMADRFIKTLTSSLIAVTGEKATIERMTPREKLREAFRNEKAMLMAWEATKQYVRTNYANNPNLLAEVNTLMNSMVPQPWTKGELTAALRQEIRDRDLTLRQLIRQHWTVGERIAGDLADNISLELGLPIEDARRFRDALIKEMNNLTSEQKRKSIEKALSAQKASPQTKKAVRSSIARIIEYSNMGLMDTLDAYSIIAEKMNLPYLTDAERNEVRRRIDIIQQITPDDPNSIQRMKAEQKLKDYISERIPVMWAEHLAMGWYGNILFSGPVQTTNLIANTLHILPEFIVNTLASGGPQDAPIILGKMLDNAEAAWTAFKHSMLERPRLGVYQDIIRHTDASYRAMRQAINGLMDPKKNAIQKAVHAVTFMRSMLSFSTSILMQSVDIPFKVNGYQMRMAALAITVAREKGLSGAELAAEVDRIMADSPQEKALARQQAEQEAAEINQIAQEIANEAEREFRDAETEEQRQAAIQKKEHSEELIMPEIAIQRRADQIVQMSKVKEYGVLHESSKDYQNFVTFNNPNAVARGVIKAFDWLDEYVSKINPKMAKSGQLMRILLGAPFVNIPLNLAARGAEWTPIGFINVMAKKSQLRGIDKSQEEMNYYAAKVEHRAALTRATLGTVTMLSLISLFLKMIDEYPDDDGPITIYGGFTPVKDTDKKYQLKESREEYSIRIKVGDDSYISIPYKFIPGLNLTLGIVGHISDYYRYMSPEDKKKVLEGGTIGDILGMAGITLDGLMGWGEVVADLTILNYLNDLTDLIFKVPTSDKTNAKPLAGKIIQFFNTVSIPGYSFFRNIESVFSPAISETKGDYAQIIRAFPGARAWGEAKPIINELGEVVNKTIYDQTLGRFIKWDKPDPLWEFMANNQLWLIHDEYDPVKHLDYNNYWEAKKRREQFLKPVLEASLPEMQRAIDDGDKEGVQDFINNVMRIGREALLRDVLSGRESSLRPEIYNEAYTELKRSAYIAKASQGNVLAQWNAYVRSREYQITFGNSNAARTRQAKEFIRDLLLKQPLSPDIIEVIRMPSKDKKIDLILLKERRMTPEERYRFRKELNDVKYYADYFIKKATRGDAEFTAIPRASDILERAL